MNFVKASLKYKQVTVSVLLLLFIVGVNSLLNMPRREDPKITVRQGLVIAYFPGASSAQVEDQVTNKLEQYLFQFEEIRKAKTYSTTQDGLVVVNVELNEKVNAAQSRYQASKDYYERISTASKTDGVIAPSELQKAKNKITFANKIKSPPVMHFAGF
jgi:multidrug efflux pump subunit AcrB